MSNPDIITSRIVTLAEALDYLAETSQDAGLRMILTHLSNEASELATELDIHLDQAKAEASA